MEKHRFFVTGTDTDVGKTRVTAALALAIKRATPATPPTVVKVVQTGLAPGQPGDAARAGKLAGVRFVELARYRKAADPYSAAYDEGALECHAGDLAAALAGIKGPVVAEGAGGIMVPLNMREHFGHVALLAKLPVVMVVGLRLGCLNHAMLTASLCDQLGLPIAGVVLVDRFGESGVDYHSDVARALQGKIEILGILPFVEDEPAAVEAAAEMFEPIL